MSLAAIRAAIVATLSAIPNIGRVHDYERYASNEKAFRDLYVSTIGGVSQLRGWHVRRLTTAESSITRGRWDNQHAWEIRGLMALDDAGASEKTFDELIEAIRAAFRADESLSGTVDSTVSPQGECLRLEQSGPVLFAGVLCHSARLQLTTRHSL